MVLKNKPVSNVSMGKSSDVFTDFIFDGLVSLGKDQPNVKVKILSDTGTTLSLLHCVFILNIVKNLNGRGGVSKHQRFDKEFLPFLSRI